MTVTTTDSDLSEYNTDGYDLMSESGSKLVEEWDW